MGIRTRHSVVMHVRSNSQFQKSVFLDILIVKLS